MKTDFFLNFDACSLGNTIVTIDDDIVKIVVAILKADFHKVLFSYFL